MSFRNLKADGQDTDNKLFQKLTNALALALGIFGHDVLTGTTTGEWGILHAFTDSVVTVIRDGTTEAAISLKAGDRLYGRITSVTVTSGTVEAYRIN